MSKLIKCSVSIILCLTLAFSLASPAFAQAECTCGQEPIIYVAALGSASLYKDAGTPDEKLIFRPDTSAYIKMVAKLLIPLFTLTLTKNYDRFADKLIAAAGEVFSPLANADNGSSTPDITTKTELPTDAAHGLDRSYYFGYDFREDPLTVADKLDKYVDAVCELTGHSKVRFRASSMGGVMTMAYLEKYGTDKIKSIIFQNCPIQGTAVAGDLFCGKLQLSADSLYRYGATALPLLLSGAGETILMGLVNFLYKTGILGCIIDRLNVFVEKEKGKVFDELLIPVFKANCGIWSFVPDKHYTEAKRFMLGENPNEELLSRIDYYHYNVQCKAGEILNSVVESGVPVMILAAYNLQRTPLVPTWEATSDGTVDAEYASVGATTALLGKTLTATPGSRLSPDRCIDASTCALPDNTWFVRDMLHCTTHKGHDGLYRWFFENDNTPEILNVNSNPLYPQFLQNDVDNEQLLPQ